MDALDLQIPDRLKLGKVDQLCRTTDPYARSEENDLLFISAMREIVDWHQSLSPLYRTLMERSGFSSSQLNDLSDLHHLPFIPAASFKEHEIVSVPREQISLQLTSSGTTGQKSQIFFDPWSIGSAQKMLDLIIAHYGWDQSSQPVRYLLYTYEPQPEMKIGTSFTDHYLCKYAKADEVFYALRNNGSGGHDFDIFGCLAFLEKCAADQIPLRVFGFPSFLYFTLRKQRQLLRPPLSLHPESLVFLGGGWKGFADQAIDRFEFYTQLIEQLGFKDERLKDGFGSVEHCIPYVECSKHHLHIPIWSRVLIRDTKNLKVLGYNKPGFLQFVSPYITSVPAHSVLMGDLATLHRASDCECGLQTDWFEVLGRAGTSKNRSCAVAASELLRGLT